MNIVKDIVYSAFDFSFIFVSNVFRYIKLSLLSHSGKRLKNILMFEFKLLNSINRFVWIAENVLLFLERFSLGNRIKRN